MTGYPFSVRAPDVVEPTYRYDRVMPQSVRYALVYGVLGGIIIGLTTLFFIRVYLTDQFSPPVKFNSTAFLVLIIAGLVFLITMLAAILIALSLREGFALTSTRSAYWMGAGVGVIFGLTMHTVLLGGLINVVANRETLPSLYQAYRPDSPEYLTILVRSIYLSVAEGMGFVLLTLLLLMVSGAVLGRFLLPIDKEKANSASSVRDVMSVLLPLLMPPTFYLTATSNIVTFAFIEPSLANMMTRAGGVYDPPISIIIIAGIFPFIAMLLAQALALLWLQLTDAVNIHRSLLRFVQIVYGLIWPVAVVYVTYLFSPGLFYGTIGRVILGLSVVLSLGYVIVAQRKLRKAWREKRQIQVSVSVLGIVGAGLSVLLLSGFLVDVLAFRMLMNAVTIPVSLADAAEYAASSAVLDDILNRVLLANNWVLLQGFAGVGIVSLVPLTVLAWLTNLVENRRRQS